MVRSSAKRRAVSKPTAVSTDIPLSIKPAAASLRQALEFQRTDNLEEALKAYDEVLKVAPNNIAALVNKGVALRRLSRHDEAMACFWRAIAQDSANLQAWSNAGNTLLDRGRLEEAEEALIVALRQGPEVAEVWVGLSRLLLARKQYAAAENVLRRAVDLRSDDYNVRQQLATLWLEQGKHEQALAEYLYLQKHAPQETLAHSGAGQALTSLGRLNDALQHLQRALQIDPNNVDAQLGLARWYLLKGDFTEGWKRYESRRSRTELKQPKVSGIEWDGSDPAGKTILLYAEQGFGDTIQFLRYIPLLAARGAKVVVVCQKVLLPIVQRVEGIVEATCVWRPLPAYDVFAPLMSLPHKMRLGSQPIPNSVPYLNITKTASLPALPIGTRLRVGLVWAGSTTHPDDHDRSAGLESFLPLAGVPGVQLYSLQVGPRAADIKKLAHPALVRDFSKHLRDFADTAAVIKQLDLVISVDTAVAHLAGALGKPVWVMVPRVPDWRWQLERTDSPWYPTMRLYRQSGDGNWSPAITSMVRDLNQLAAEAPLIEPPPAEVRANSIFTKADGKPRFRMSAPRAFLQDPGIGFLMRKERTGVGYEYATRCLLDAHLKPCDLFLDVGAHWGLMSLHVATKFESKSDQIDVIAFEPSPCNQQYLRQWIDANNAADRIAIISAAVSDRAGKGELRPESTMGHSLDRREDGAIPVVTIDDELAKRPELAGRRVIVKIDVEGHEPEVLAGMKGLLNSGHVAIVIWERGVEYNEPEGQKRLKALRKDFDALGFTAWRFESEDNAGNMVPFIENGQHGNIIEFASNQKPIAAYGDLRPTMPQPSDPQFDKAEPARVRMQMGTAAYEAGKIEQALEYYAEAGLADMTSKDLYNNLGVMLGATKPAAKMASCRRAHALAPKDAGIMSNLANILREQGHLVESSRLHDEAVALSPKNPLILHNAALTSRDDGRPEDALPVIDKALQHDPSNADVHWDRALLLLQKGDYGAGFPAYEGRWQIKRSKKRAVPLNRWDGSELNGESIYLHDEQGFGDVLMFARFIPELKRRGAGKVVLECQPELMRLMTYAPGVDAVIPRERALPQCDLYCPLLSLPGIFGTTLKTLPNKAPYLFAPEPSPVTLAALPNDKRLKIGLVWAGQLIPRDRSCPLEKLLPILSDPKLALISLQVGSRVDDLEAFGAKTFITDMSPYIVDFAETAAVMNQLDLMITIDTSVAHLAGALGVPTFTLLRYTSDWRWFDRIEDSPWYPSMKLFRQANPLSWDEAIESLHNALRNFVQ